MLLRNGNASGKISIPATDDEYYEDELITTIYQKTQKDDKQSNNSDSK